MNTNQTPRNNKFDPARLLKPYGSITVTKLKGTKPDRALDGLISQVRTALNRGRTKLMHPPSLSDTAPLKGTALTIRGLDWEVELHASSFTDGRTNREHRYFVAVTNGTYVAFSTNDDSMRKAVGKRAGLDAKPDA